ncbi:MAG: hypothetical protein EB141_18945, partial [Verrucomicrobia bacterium]|nr:hypothetical protein [Verrucomicrobiota bacterium]
HIGPFCVIGEHVTLGPDCRLHSHVVVDGHTTLGTGNELFPFAAIGLAQAAETRALNKVGMERNGVSEAAQAALKKAHKLLFRDGLTISNALAKIEAELPPLPELLHLIAFVRASERGISK